MNTKVDFLILLIYGSCRLTFTIGIASELNCQSLQRNMVDVNSTELHENSFFENRLFKCVSNCLLRNHEVRLRSVVIYEHNRCKHGSTCLLYHRGTLLYGNLTFDISGA